MTDDEIFVKRVGFEVNNNDKPVSAPPIINNGTANDVEKLEKVKKKTSCTTKFCSLLDKFGIKKALSHIGLLLSLGLYCWGGGWVKIKIHN